MIAADIYIPPVHEERVVCSIVASLEYKVPADIMLAIAEVEGGAPGVVSANTNGTVDIGPMQFNSGYLGSLRKYGITADDVNKSGCYPYRLAAWRVKNHLVNDEGDIWTRAANYHSRTPYYNRIYREKLLTAAKKWLHWLRSQFTTHVTDGSR
jgi:hypothetical protein